MTMLLTSETTTGLRPRYEGLNINSWIGFKHINYLVEEAVLEHFRIAGASAHSLFEEYGLCVEVVEVDTRITTAIHTDDLVEATVLPSQVDNELALGVSLFVQRGGERRKAARSRVRVLLRQDHIFEPAEHYPEDLHAFIAPHITRVEPPVDQPRSDNSFTWSWRIPYFYCHFTERLQMSGYLRLMEEVVDLFLADRGVSVNRLLEEQLWIPLVSRSSITMLNEVVMEEELETVFTVESVFKNFNYTARMDTYVRRNGRPLRTATGRITHAYGEILNRREIKVVEFDRRLRTALEGG